MKSAQYMRSLTESSIESLIKKELAEKEFKEKLASVEDTIKSSAISGNFEVFFDDDFLGDLKHKIKSKLEELEYKVSDSSREQMNFDSHQYDRVRGVLIKW